MPANLEQALAEFDRAITPRRIRTMRILHLAFPLSLVLFSVVLAGVAANAPAAPAEGSLRLANALTIANVVLFCSGWFAGGLLFNALLAPGRIAQAAHASPKSAPETCLDQLQLASLLRLACVEASACFGLAVCVVLLLQGVLPAERAYWFNALPAVVLAAYALYTMPSVPRLRVLFLVKIARHFQR